MDDENEKNRSVKEPEINGESISGIILTIYLMGLYAGFQIFRMPSMKESVMSWFGLLEYYNSYTFLFCILFLAIFFALCIIPILICASLSEKIKEGSSAGTGNYRNNLIYLDHESEPEDDDSRSDSESGYSDLGGFDIGGD
ncbi:hypothetical protein F1737_07065 [Methanoplanus sp. FWC-SCC4]|uniref:Uncharacterized protein n=1 Tax=Methanochimaera problematica TaxID=2609417 RepID=A0AA97FCE1_9EURY|nr:hypothetical protein [Methanoplanus sp. FWC-SCC4]WOF16477.1 hypothetical protein F1737_07065 [Methanoplanus sp. FWC-SCC4]